MGFYFLVSWLPCPVQWWLFWLWLAIIHIWKFERKKRKHKLFHALNAKSKSQNRKTKSIGINVCTSIHFESNNIVINNKITKFLFQIFQIFGLRSPNEILNEFCVVFELINQSINIIHLKFNQILNLRNLIEYGLSILRYPPFCQWTMLIYDFELFYIVYFIEWHRTNQWMYSFYQIKILVYCMSTM